MSLYVYSGVPSSGKSYHACRDIKYNKAPTITNMRVSGINDVAVLDLQDIKPDMLMAFSLRYFEEHKFKENCLLLVLDEAQLLFNSRTWDSSDRFAWLEFLSQHRHYGYKVVLVAQDISMIDKQFRCLCEYDCRHVSLGSMSTVTRAFHMLGVKLTCAKYYYYDTDVLISRDMYTISKRVYAHYDTRQDLTGGDFSDVDVSPIVRGLDATSQGAERPAVAPGRAHPFDKAIAAFLALFGRPGTPEDAEEVETAAESAA